MAINFLGGEDLASTVARLRALAGDLERMTMFLPRVEVEDAPVLRGYRYCSRKVPSLVGRVEGHPLLGNRTVVTSELYAIDRAAGWARTFSRFYRIEDATYDQTEC